MFSEFFINRPKFALVISIVTVLVGLASKNAILIVGFAMNRRAEGASVFEAAQDAASLRFRAVMMTALSFVLGILPLVVATGAGAASRRTLGSAILGGMLAAIVIGVILVPVLYLILQRVRERLKGAGPETQDSLQSSKR